MSPEAARLRTGARRVPFHLDQCTLTAAPTFTRHPEALALFRASLEGCTAEGQATSAHAARPSTILRGSLALAPQDDES